MIPFDFEYVKPKDIQEARKFYLDSLNNHKTPLYFSGGTELITLGRINQLFTDYVIDLKGLQDFTKIYFQNEYLVIGAGVTLTAIEESNTFPLLRKNVSEIADRTARNKITIGGNICGQIFYREAILPLLISNSIVGIAGQNGVKYVPLSNLFDQRLLIEKGEFLYQILVPKDFLQVPYVHIKRRMQWDIGYPLVSLSSIKKENRIRIAVSGVCPFPFRSSKMETILNDRRYSIFDRVNDSVEFLPKPILDDVEGSSEYRVFVLKNILLDVLSELEELN